MNDIYIKVLQYGRDNLGFSFDDIKSNFPEEYDWLYTEIQLSNIFVHDNLDLKSEETKFYLSFEDRFKLLEYEELKEARASSKKAMTIAIISILLTFISIIYSSLSTSNVNVVSSYEDKKIISKIKSTNLGADSDKSNPVKYDLKPNKANQRGSK